MTDHQPPVNLDAEECVLGCVFLADNILPVLTVDVGLRPGHFYDLEHGRIYQTMLKLADQGARVDAVAVAAALPDIRPARIHTLAGPVPGAGNHRHYAQIIIDQARLRGVQTAAHELLAGVAQRDEQRIDQAETMLANARHTGSGERRTSEPEDLADEIYDMLAAGEPETFRWPFPRLDKLTMGGMRRGQLTLVAGWSSHGKSVFLDQCLESAAHAGMRVHLFINEMTKQERTCRTLARLCAVDFERILLNRLEPPERVRVTQALGHIPFGITDIAGWTAQDVAREVKRRRYDVVGVDILNRFPTRGRDRRAEIEEISRQLNELVKPTQANCHLLLATHLNRNRAGQSLVLPFPSIADLRDTGMLGNDADNVMFVHRDQDEETGEPLAVGMVRLAKVRNGRPGGVLVAFRGEQMRFTARGPQPMEAAA